MTEPVALRVTPAAARMRLYRARARHGSVVADVEVLPAEVDELVRRGFLAPELRGSRVAIGQAVERVLARALRSPGTF